MPVCHCAVPYVFIACKRVSNSILYCVPRYVLRQSKSGMHIVQLLHLIGLFVHACLRHAHCIAITLHFACLFSSASQGPLLLPSAPHRVGRAPWECQHRVCTHAAAHGEAQVLLTHSSLCGTVFQTRHRVLKTLGCPRMMPHTCSSLTSPCHLFAKANCACGADMQSLVCTM